MIPVTARNWVEKTMSQYLPKPPQAFCCEAVAPMSAKASKVAA